MGQIIYVDHSDIREGKLEELKPAINELTELVKAKEPRILEYKVYFTKDGKRMTVIHIHPDSASLEFHISIAGPEFPKFADFIKLTAIDIYGHPSDNLLKQLNKKAEMLGSGTVVVHSLHTGFTRLKASFV